ncbi:MAG: lasso peptide biosynthesis PqqD family chaperone [Acetatifactor sp.]|nr:lasso peptide biosynthesis PqqD family chaperone [Acetatifactor sp.]
MEKNREVKLKKKINVTDLSGEKVMVDFEQGKYFLIKGVGNDIWDMIQEPVTPEQIIERLLQEYEVTPQECENSVMDFLDKMEDLGFIEQ